MMRLEALWCFSWERHDSCRQFFHTRDDAAGSALSGSVMAHAANNFHTLDDVAGSALFRSVMTLAAKKDARAWCRKFSASMTRAGVPGVGVKLALCELEHLLETIQAGVPGM